MVTIVTIINMRVIVGMTTFIIITAMPTIIHIRGIVKIATILIIGIFLTIVTIVEISIHCLTVVVE
jgi:hypothetical protein